MKCRLVDNPHVDKNFEIDFESLQEIEEFRDSLNAMIKYCKMCERDGDDLPQLVYKITNKKNSKTK
jgi:hypothetical protein